MKVVQVQRRSISFFGSGMLGAIIAFEQSRAEKPHLEVGQKVLVDDEKIADELQCPPTLAEESVDLTFSIDEVFVRHACVIAIASRCKALVSEIDIAVVCNADPNGEFGHDGPIVDHSFSRGLWPI
ncbi:MAG: hypothetical protein J0I29_05825 [Rhizobiales bacterium]|nr:hypothetical protein [Hyphomicrobiales bacterium]